jgi:hypothetical protein
MCAIEQYCPRRSGLIDTATPVCSSDLRPIQVLLLLLLLLLFAMRRAPR